VQKYGPDHGEKKGGGKWVIQRVGGDFYQTKDRKNWFSLRKIERAKSQTNHSPRHARTSCRERRQQNCTCLKKKKDLPKQPLKEGTTTAKQAGPFTVVVQKKGDRSEAKEPPSMGDGKRWVYRQLNAQTKETKEHVNEEGGKGGPTDLKRRTLGRESCRGRQPMRGGKAIKLRGEEG